MSIRSNAELLKVLGDVEGHEFHGNQYSAAAGAASKDAHDASSKAKDEVGHQDAAKAHDKARAAHTEAAKHAPKGLFGNISKAAREHSAKAVEHGKEASAHRDAAWKMNPLNKK